VNAASGKQTLEMIKENPVTGEIDIKDSIDCIHTAVCDIPVEDFEDTVTDENFEQNILKIRSSEKSIQKIELIPEEKFKAFQSWVAGIAEAGLDSFRIQADIESWGRLGGTIALRLMKFIAKVDKDVMYEFLLKIEKECRYNGMKHEQSLIANLNPILHMIDDTNDDIIRAIFAIEPPIALFTKELDNAHFLKYPEAADLPEFRLAFSVRRSAVLMALAQNPRAAEFEEFQSLFSMDWLHEYLLSNPGAARHYDHLRKYYSYRSEPNWIVRKLAASNAGAVRFDEFTNFLSEASEPEFLVRKSAASNPAAVNLPKFKNFLSSEIEPDGRVRTAAAYNFQSVKYPEYKNFLSAITEIRTPVRAGAARNPFAVILDDYANFLSSSRESNVMVRTAAASNLNAPNRHEFRNFLSVDTETNEIVRLAAVKNPGAIIFAEYEDLFEEKTEPNRKIRYFAKLQKTRYREMHK
jgi:hypothetical protein